VRPLDRPIIGEIKYFSADVHGREAVRVSALRGFTDQLTRATAVSIYRAEAGGFSTGHGLTFHAFLAAPVVSNCARAFIIVVAASEHKEGQSEEDGSEYISAHE
jgi:hypothetical protein